MAGNVWEWMDSLYYWGGWEAFEAEKKVLKGGSCASDRDKDKDLAVSYRGHYTHPMNLSYSIGFRCVK